MIGALLRHHIHSLNAGTSKASGLRNCHVKGLHSIMLHNEPENRIRLFATDSTHELWRNMPGYGMSLAFHPHHCDVTLVAVDGAVFNRSMTLLSDGQEARDFGKATPPALTMCKYQSAIGEGRGRLVPTEVTTRRYLTGCTAVHRFSEGLFMPARQMHSIYVGKYERVAWLVIEGKEDPAYESVCYTDNPVFDTKGDKDMYSKMSELEMIEMLTSVQLWRMNGR